MPQMSPMWWLMLYTTTIMVLLIINSITYFNYQPTMKKYIKKNTTKMKWKW
uniref:ATP synthase complex subunit 8 n=1 Tax=Balala fujiana TaxID=2800226 RepID=A0A7T7BYV9_9HEMI|nr:ATP synthase F0 subunit 8 [Balala fujiana]QQK57702.1 ATP synthase F0 subunit 8 [Balala fujiana]